MPKNKGYKKLAGWIGMIIALIVAVAIGGSFIAGKFLDVILLSYLPLIVHQVVGWIIVGGTILSLGLSLFK